jgi:hypothetical protein
MIISSWPRLVIGALVLMISAAAGIFAWTVETCTNDSAGSLSIGLLALVGNVVAWLLLGRRVPSNLVLLVAALSALGALSYTYSTVQLAVGYFKDGLSACDVIKRGQDFGMDGREPIFILIWLLACISFWGGLAPIVLRAIRVHGGTAGNE